jgi:hypothetical protein
MIHDMDFSMYLWAEACDTVVYILNKCPPKILKDKTSKEAFSCEKPQVPHFRVYGCSIHIHLLEK